MDELGEDALEHEEFEAEDEKDGVSLGSDVPRPPVARGDNSEPRECVEVGLSM